MLRIKELRLQWEMSQDKLSRLLNVARSTISMWENGSVQPDITSLNNLATVFNTTVDYILGRDIDHNIPAPTGDGVWVPVLGMVQAGIPVEAVQDILDYEEIPQSMAAKGEYFALKIRGQSMEPKMSEGDVVIVKKQSTVENNEIAVVLVNGHDATVKKLSVSKDGIILIPTNPNFETKFYSNDDIANLPITILGKVVELRAKF